MVRSLPAWAQKKQRLPENVALTVKQKKPRKVYGRARGYTDKEAVAVLRASKQREPKPNQPGRIHWTRVDRDRLLPPFAIFMQGCVGELPTPLAYRVAASSRSRSVARTARAVVRSALGMPSASRFTSTSQSWMAAS